MVKRSLIVLILGFVVLLAGVFAPVIRVMTYTAKNGAIAVIGGVDTKSSAVLMYSGLPTVLILFGVSIIICSIFCLIFIKSISNECSVKTSIVSIGISAVISLEIYCILAYISCFFLTSPDRHPIRYPASIIVAGICLIAYVLLLWLYFRHRKSNMSASGVIIDIAFTAMYIVPMFLAYAFIHNTISSFLN